MQFRPLRSATIAVVIVLPILIGLGVWQLQRLHWKEGLLAALDRNMHARPVSLNDSGIVIEEPETQYLRVAVRGHFLHAKETYLFGSDTAGSAGYHVITPLETDDHRIFLIDRGYVPSAQLSPATRAAGQVGGERHVVGLLRWPSAPGLFTPRPDPTHRVWYARDPVAMAKADGLGLAQPAIIDADATPNPGGWPRGGQTIVDIPNNHLSYALTWFALAAVLVGVYLAYHISLGRLTFARSA
jgi:surfeit locus 1 family protein